MIGRWISINEPASGWRDRVAAILRCAADLADGRVSIWLARHPGSPMSDGKFRAAAELALTSSLNIFESVDAYAARHDLVKKAQA